MTNHIKKLTIKNFKSIKSIDLDCNRINLFIGKPNVGKSNILEALSIPTTFGGVSLNTIIRFDNFSHLFYDQDIEEEIIIETDNLKNKIYYKFDIDNYYLTSEYLEYIEKAGEYEEILIEQELNILGRGSNKLKKRDNSKCYIFKTFDINTAVKTNGSLNAPFGENLITILQTNKSLRKQVAQYFAEYGLELVLDIHNQTIEIQKKIDGIVYQLPYNLMADTLQRIIFYSAAIQSNKNSTLIFEEPENHSFPPYIREFAHQIVASKTNQFFISTHSPYLLQTILQDADLEDVGVFIANFDDYQTKVQKLTKDQLREVLDYGIDLFFNLDIFENE